MEILKVINEEEKLYPKFNELKAKKKINGFNKLKNIFVYITSVLILLENKALAYYQDEPLDVTQFEEMSGDGSIRISDGMWFLSTFTELTNALFVYVLICIGVLMTCKKVFDKKEKKENKTINEDAFIWLRVYVWLFTCNIINWFLINKFIFYKHYENKPYLLDKTLLFIVIFIFVCIIYFVTGKIFDWIKKRKTTKEI